MSEHDHDAAIADERRVAARRLLADALVLADGPYRDDFAAIRRHAEWLTTAFRQLLGYEVVVEARFARLLKAGPGPGAGRALVRSTGTPFSPRTYVYLTLGLAALVTASEQVLLSQLVSDIRGAAADARIELDDAGRQVERRTLAAALRQLVQWGVLVEVDGSLGNYVEKEDAEALLSVDRDLARALIAGPLAQASDAVHLIALAHDPGHHGVRVAVRRRLVESPVVFRDELDPDEDEWLRKNQRREARTFEEFLALHAEIRAEGVALLDPADELSDVAFPGRGTVAQAALLLIERLAGRLRPDEPAASVPLPAVLIDDTLAELVTEYARKAGWQRDLVENPLRFRAEVTDLLVHMRLLRVRRRSAAGVGTDADTSTGAGTDTDTGVGTDTDTDTDTGTGTTTWEVPAVAARYASRLREQHRPRAIQEGLPL
ncbi:TIGR02678 family protein [Streptomyces sp. SID3343]|uniref:TIGR02678 family protein n=1 Tax=Streptomyces sp. SID3343 TaxID=2690260 RepID=UPI00136ADB17|nr:TIGR02678 family protein [Streptomyces sp. SID3343]MYV98404.1 TIGR02678 family protein [Streptomyces sp. SID3343]